MYKNNMEFSWKRVNSIFVVFLASFALFVNNGFIFVGLTVFDPVMLDRLGVSVGALKGRDAVTLITAAILSPLSGYMLDRVGARPIMAIGMMLMAIGMLAYASATSLTEIYLIHLLFGCSLVMAGLFVCVILVTGVTSRHRGFAVGVILAGASLGQAVSPKLNAILEAMFGWQNALRIGAALPLLAVPLVLILVPKMPRPVPQESGFPKKTDDLSYRDALRTRNFWLLSAIAMVTFFAQLGIATNLVLYVDKQLKQNANVANAALFTLFMTALVFQLVAGFLADRLGAKRIHMVSILIMGAGIALLAFGPADRLLLSVALIGIGWGGNYAAIQVMTSKIFAGYAMGRILGTINVIEATGAGLGPPGIGYLYDMTNTYAFPFGLAAGAVLLTSLAVSQITPVKDHADLGPEPNTEPKTNTKELEF